MCTGSWVSLKSSSWLHLLLGCWCSRPGSWAVVELLVTDSVVGFVAAAAPASKPILLMPRPPRAQSAGFSTD